MSQFGQIITGTQLKDRLQEFVGDDDDLTDSTVAGWINNAISEFPDIAFVTQKETYTDVLANVAYELPLDFGQLEDYSVFNSETGAYDSYSKKKKIRITNQDYIIFPEDLDTISMEYNRVQDLYDDLTVELPLRRQLRPVLYYYILSEYYSKDGEGNAQENRLATNYILRYERQKERLLNKLEHRESNDTEDTTDVMYKRSRKHSPYTQESNFDEYDGNGDVI